MKKIVICSVVGVTVVVAGLCVMCMLCRGDRCPLMSWLKCGSGSPCGGKGNVEEVQPDIAEEAPTTE